jgi:hypothetical protein
MRSHKFNLGDEVVIKSEDTPWYDCNGFVSKIYVSGVDKSCSYSVVLRGFLGREIIVEKVSESFLKPSPNSLRFIKDN